MKKDPVSNDDFYPWGFNILDKWMQIKNRNSGLKSYFCDNKMQTVAIYGMGALGKRLIEQLKQDGIKVSYGIDKKKSEINIDGIPVYSPEDILPTVDVIVVTPIFFYEIEEMLRSKFGAWQNIVSIEEIINYCIE